MNPKALLVLILPLFLTFGKSVLNAQQSNSMRDSLIQETIQYVHKEKYDSVFKYTDQLIEKFPYDPPAIF